jgi:hypothetical protein
MHIVIESRLNAALSLRFLETLVVVSLKLDQWFKDVFVLPWVSVPQENRLHGLLLNLLFGIQVCNLSLRLLLPELFKLIDILRLDFP